MINNYPCAVVEHCPVVNDIFTHVHIIVYVYDAVGDESITFENSRRRAAKVSLASLFSEQYEKLRTMILKSVQFVKAYNK